MLLLLITIISFMLIFLYMHRKNKKIREGFQTSSSSSTSAKSSSISQILSDISLDVNKYDTDSEIDFKDLELDLKTFSDEDLESIIAQLPQNTKESSSIQEPDFSQFNLSNNKLESIQESQNKYEETIKKIEEEKKKLFKAKLLRELIIKKKLEKEQELDLLFQQKKISRLEDYSKNRIKSLMTKCPMEPYAYNSLQQNYNPLITLDITKHPIKWYGMDARLKNRLPANFSYF